MDATHCSSLVFVLKRCSSSWPSVDAVLLQLALAVDTVEPVGRATTSSLHHAPPQLDSPHLLYPLFCGAWSHRCSSPSSSAAWADGRLRLPARPRQADERLCKLPVRRFSEPSRLAVELAGHRGILNSCTPPAARPLPVCLPLLPRWLACSQFRRSPCTLAVDQAHRDVFSLALRRSPSCSTLSSSSSSTSPRPRVCGRLVLSPTPPWCSAKCLNLSFVVVVHANIMSVRSWYTS